VNVWLVKIEEQLPIDINYRPYRMGMLEKSLIERGHTVTRWCSDYNYSNKENRYGARNTIKFSDNLIFELLPDLPIFGHKTIVQKMIQNVNFYFQFKKAIKQLSNTPDIIVCSMPTPELTLASASFSKLNNIPLVIDARDMWPHIIEEELHGIKKILAKPLIFIMKISLSISCRRAYSLVGITDFFRDYLLDYSNRTLSKYDAVFPLGYLKNKNKAIDYEAHLQKIGLHLDSQVIYFAGKLNSTVFNTIHHVIGAAKIIETRFPLLKIVICGDGSHKDKIKILSDNCSNIITPGRVDSNILSALKSVSIASLLPIERRVDYQNSLSNKFFEYIADGLPILSHLDGVPGEVIKKYKIGYVYSDEIELSSYIEKLLLDPVLRLSMSENAINLFKDKFDGNKVYKDFSKHLEMVFKDYNKTQ
jgi:glycosyltransferase involved in cell wall biosynthesis